jgi:hypothetical protein
MAGQIRRLTLQHRIFVLQCVQTISHEPARSPARSLIDADVFMVGTLHLPETVDHSQR